jgi:endonuclease/exonuclease/phosphatase family metal-dependent hydrolase
MPTVLSLNCLTQSYAPDHRGTPIDPAKRQKALINEVLEAARKGMVICLQEVWEELMAALTKELEDRRYACFYSGWIGAKNAEMGLLMAIPSGYRFEDKRAILYMPKRPQVFQVAIVEGPEGRFILVNAHVPARWGDQNFMRGCLLALYMSAVTASYGTIPEKPPKAPKIGKVPEAQCPVIIIGDMNIRPELLREYFADDKLMQPLLSARLPYDGPSTRTQKTTDPEPFEGAIDHCFLFGGTGTASVPVIPVDQLLPGMSDDLCFPSDHVPLTVILSFHKKADT